MKKSYIGWGFLESKEEAKEEEENITFAFARLFGSLDGKKVLAHLESLTMARVLPQDASDAELRYLEGKRALFFHIKTMIKTGQTKI